MCDISSRRDRRGDDGSARCAGDGIRGARRPAGRRARRRDQARRPNRALVAPPAPADNPRQVFRRLVAELFSFLTEEHTCGEPEFEEGGVPGRPRWLDAIFRGPLFTVHIGLTIAGAGESSVLTCLRGDAVNSAGERGWDNNIDALAFSHGLTKRRWTVPSDARTGDQLRRSLTTQAELARALLATVPS